MERHEQLAEALKLIAGADHYMVGLVEPVSIDEIDNAEQILITNQNKTDEGTIRWAVYDLAIDLCEQMRGKYYSTADEGTDEGIAA